MNANRKRPLRERIKRLNAFADRLRMLAREGRRIADLPKIGVFRDAWWQIHGTIERRYARASELKLIALALQLGEWPGRSFLIYRSADEVRARFAPTAETVQ